MAKKGIHPEWHSDAKVICNGEEVLTTSGTQGSYTGAFHCSLLLHIAAADDDDAVLLMLLMLMMMLCCCWSVGLMAVIASGCCYPCVFCRVNCGQLAEAKVARRLACLRRQGNEPQLLPARHCSFNMLLLLLPHQRIMFAVFACKQLHIDACRSVCTSVYRKPAHAAVLTCLPRPTLCLLVLQWISGAATTPSSRATPRPW